MDTTVVLNIVGILALVFTVLAPFVLLPVIRRNHEQSPGGWLNSTLRVLVLMAGWLVAAYVFVVVIVAPLAGKLKL